VDTTLAEIVEEGRKAGLALEWDGACNPRIEAIVPLQAAAPGTLVFLDRAEALCCVAEGAPAAVVTTPRLRAALLERAIRSSVVCTPNVPLAHAWIRQRHAGRDYDAADWGDAIHPSAVVHPSACVDPTARVEPRVVIGRGARIGARTRIMAGVVVEHDAQIGDDCVIHPGAVIGYGCRLGREVHVGAGSVIGSEGFGFAQDAARRSHPIPQTGIVVIGDRVRLGANNCIDRATFGETRIGAGTKFDNLCHVAHNVEIGQDCLLTAMFCIAGSSRIGNRVIASGQTGIIDHVSVCDDVVLVHRAGVVKDIDAPGMHAALPAQPFDAYLRNTAAARAGAELRRRVAQLERAVPAASGAAHQVAEGACRGAAREGGLERATLEPEMVAQHALQQRVE
jgi:UDP-3-O-[3-hydroxymyristoyl] glucosamine N-acyltransferase